MLLSTFSVLVSAFWFSHFVEQVVGIGKMCDVLVCFVVKGVEASTNGVLGGYAQVNEPDIMGSEAFLKQLLSERFPDSANGQRHLVVLGTQNLSFSMFFFV